MAGKKQSRFVYNVETGLAFAATDVILQNMHKKNMHNLRLMPKGWRPGDEIELDHEELELTDDMVTALAKRLARKMDGASEEEIRLAIADATGKMPAPAGDEPQLSDPNLIQEIVAVIAEMDPDNPDEYTIGGKPDAKVIGRTLDRNVTAAERDEAFEFYKTQMQG